jgi:CRP/FNR family transcriptional regulator, cyclic AMP receptor protein
MKMRHRAGDVLFREGDPSDFACLILEGVVEVRRDVGDESVLLGELTVGDMVGEMGVLENQPRSAGVTAQSDVEVEVISADKFIDRVAGAPDAARRLLTRQSSRVRTLTEEVSRLYEALHRLDPDAARACRPATPHPGSFSPPPALVPAARPQEKAPPRLTVRCLGAAGDALLVISRLPYRIGRRAPEAGQFDSDEQTLLVNDSFPHRVSVNHFAVAHDEKLGLVVRDLGSDLGTTVNGQFLGGIFAKDTCRLLEGVNTVVAGGLDSPFVFKILVE